MLAMDLVRWARFEVKRAWWHLRRLLHLGVQYTVIAWKMATGGRVGLESRLSARVWSPEHGWRNLGVIGTKCVTNVLTAILVDCLQGVASGLTDVTTFKYHKAGTGVTGELVTDTALGTPTGEATLTGTQTEGSGANIYKSVATYTCTVSAGLAITEHGLFNFYNKLMDRTVFGAINVALGNKIEFTYELSVVAGG